MDIGEHAGPERPPRMQPTEAISRFSPARATNVPPLVSTLLYLQRTAGNQAVNRLLQGYRDQNPSSGRRAPGLVPFLQRCGATPCNCSAAERATHRMTERLEARQPPVGRAVSFSEQDDTPIQRFTATPRATTLFLQRDDDTQEDDPGTTDPAAVAGDPSTASASSPGNTITIDPVTISDGPSKEDGNTQGSPITIDPVTVVGDPNAAKNESCKKQVDNDVQGCLDKANTACSIYGAAIAGSGAAAGALLGPIGAGIGAVGGGVFGAKKYGECVENVGKDCRESTDREKEQCDIKFPRAGN